MTTLNKVVFLDRDGVINEDSGYVYEWNKFVFIDGSIEALSIFIKLGFKIIIVTNQSGIARGYFTENDFHKLSRYLISYLKQKEIELLDIFYCPHLPDGSIIEYSISCSCRKPSPGMILSAKEKHNVNLGDSFLAGDKETDILAASRSGIGCKVLLGGTKEMQKSSSADKFFPSLLHFSQYLLNKTVC